MAAKTPLEKCFDCIIDIYHQYSIQKPHHDMLNKRELARMMKEQLPMCLLSKKNPEAIDRIFKELDQDGDGEVSFDESMALMSRALIITHNKFHNKPDHDHDHDHDH